MGRGELKKVITEVSQAYAAYEFHRVYRLIYDFCTLTLSARYFDIIKDRLYTAAPRSHQRRSAQTALYLTVHALARMLAPILVFTADEIWENLPAGDDYPPSVHIVLFPEGNQEPDTELLSAWKHLFTYRDLVLAKLEEARTSKLIGSSLEARVQLSAGQTAYKFLAAYGEQLRFIFIVSEVELIAGGPNMESEEIQVRIERAQGEKCERCWNYSVHVGQSTRYPTVCERCLEALKEIERDSA